MAAPAALAVPGSAEAPVAGVRVTECSRGPEAADRFVEFRGAMRQVAGSETMWMRFGLQERPGDRAFAKVRVPDLGVWRKSRPGVPRFVYRQQVREAVTKTMEAQKLDAWVYPTWSNPPG